MQPLQIVFVVLGVALLAAAVIYVFKTQKPLGASALLLGGIFLVVMANDSISCSLGTKLECKHGVAVPDKVVAKADENLKQQTAQQPSAAPVAAQGVAIVIYRDGQETRAAKLTAALLAKGFKSSETNSSLSEIQQWVGNSKPGAIYVAVKDTNSDVAKAALGVVQATFPGQTIETGDGWTFKSSDVQVYMF